MDSYFFHADPVTAGTNFVGSITFSTDILGVILRSNLLDDSDGLLGFPTTAYPTALNFRGVDLQSTDATIILSGDRRTVSFDITTQTVVDQFRVITAASTAQVVPEPSTLALLGLGFAVLVVYQRRSRCRIRLP